LKLATVEPCPTEDAMSKGLVLKILGVTILLGGLAVGPWHLVDARQGAVTNETTASAPATPRAASVPEDSDAPAPRAQASAPDPVVEAAVPAPRPDRRGAALLGGRPNFVSACRYSHSAPDDPIVFPGQEGASHLHDFFGNTSTDADSTYGSLQASGDTSCRIDADTAAYWVPALYDSGARVTPVRTLVYYTPGGKEHTTIQPFPAGLEVVAKDGNVVTRWACNGRSGIGRNQTDIPGCPEGTHLVMKIRFPDCWDGSNLDSADHTSHMTFSRRRACPASHPVPVPAISVNVHYPSDGGDIVLGAPDKPVAPHADFFNAWDQPALERLVRVCLNAGLHCGQQPPTT
jgi:hypothetical protein